MTEKAPEKVVDRIRKMLALANDLAATEAERETALRMAYNLMTKYNLDQKDVERTKAEPRIDNESIFFGMPWVRRLSNAIATLFFCEYYYSKQKVNATQMRHHFVGKESNAITAAVMADWITKSILKECRSRYTHNLCPESREFAVGAVERLCERIRGMRKQATSPTMSDSKALVLADVYSLEKEANEAFLAQLGVRLSSSRTRSKGASGDAYHRGRAFGDTINLSRQVSKAPSGMLE